MSFRPENGMRRVLIACTAVSLLGVLSALLDYSFAHGALRSSLRGDLRQEFARLVGDLLPHRHETAAALHAHAGLKLGAMTEAEPPAMLTASMMPVGPVGHEGEEVIEINRELKADRMVTEIAVPKLILPEPEPIGEGASAALFLLSPSISAPAAPPPPPAPAALASTESAMIVSGPVASATPVALPARPPMKNLFVTSATAAVAAAPAAAKYGWNDLMRMASTKGGDGEEPNKPFGALSEKEFRARELRCMATAVYFEARGETVRGQIAVGQVIMNRVNSDFYPKTICGVVFQGQWNKNACQFSFACDGVTDAPKEKEQWATALDVAKQVISGKAYLNDIADATHYHAVYVRPDWRREVKRIKQIGVHIFYKAPFINPLASDPDYAMTQTGG
jgi:spore germination cell wall hydrolase CwlJ-like protein